MLYVGFFVGAWTQQGLYILHKRLEREFEILKIYFYTYIIVK